VSDQLLEQWLHLFFVPDALALLKTIWPEPFQQSPRTVSELQSLMPGRSAGEVMNVNVYTRNLTSNCVIPEETEAPVKLIG
jgi:hypothetical protein